MNNRWKAVWNNRKFEKFDDMADEFQIYKYLKRLDGFDTQFGDENDYYKTFYNEILNLYATRIKSFESIYEVGCGSGANLFLFNNRGKKIGGIDYSKQLVNIAKSQLKEVDLVADEASNMNTMEKYDVVISDSVFAYFEDYNYAEKVLSKMYEKAKSEIIILEILDKDYELESLTYRRSKIPNYDERYKGLEKLYYKRQIFEHFARAHNCNIEFWPVKNDYYWNSKYMYNCIIHKKDEIFRFG